MNSAANILITGASSGVGAELAKAYAGSGVKLFLSGRQSERLEAVAQECRKRGAQAVTAIIDVRNSEELAGWIQSIDNEHPIDVLIANAGISNAGKRVTCEKNQLLFDVNLQGVLNTIHPIIPRMEKRKQGHIVLMSSLAGFAGRARAPAYCASKAAVRIYGEALGGQLKKAGVHVSVVCPGFIKTPLTDKNDFYMPFLMDVDKATYFIKKKLSQKKTFIFFPWRLYALLWILRLLPARIGLKITQKL